MQENQKRKLKQPKKKLTVKPKKSLQQPKLRSQIGITARPMLSECCRAYSMAIVDPWCLESGVVGIPDNIPLPSFKFTTRARGTFTIGTAGCGYVAANPFAASTQGTGSNLFAAVISTDGTYGYSDYRYSVPGYTLEPGVVATWPDSPLSLNQFAININKPGSGIHIRPVGVGLKIRYVSSEFNRGGRVFVYRSPLNLPLIESNITGPQFVPQADLTRNKETSTVTVDRQWHAAVYKPSTPQDLSYGEFDDVLLGVYPRRMVSGPSLLMFVSGATPQQSFEFDFIGHYEAVGPNLPGFTRTNPDPLGMAAVGSANSTVQPTTSVEQNTKSFMSSVKDSLASMSHVATTAAPVLIEGVKHVANARQGLNIAHQMLQG